METMLKIYIAIVVIVLGPLALYAIFQAYRLILTGTGC